jgi:fatty-acyl-CoA synthase
VGRPYEFTEVVVLNPETGEECPDNVAGEICCRGYLVMKGTTISPATAEFIDKNGFLHSVTSASETRTVITASTGRIKDMIIRGVKIFTPVKSKSFSIT